MTRTRVVQAGSLALALVVVLLLVVFRGPGGRRAVLVSGVIALTVQAIAFTLTRLASPGNVFKAWGVGSLLRFVVLVVYALAIVKPFALPAVPALLSLAALFFVSTILESLLLTS